MQILKERMDSPLIWVIHRLHQNKDFQEYIKWVESCHRQAVMDMETLADDTELRRAQGVALVLRDLLNLGDETERAVERMRQRE